MKKILKKKLYQEIYTFFNFNNSLKVKMIFKKLYLMFILKFINSIYSHDIIKTNHCESRPNL